ncbi:Kazal-type serine protease inhibitor family protein [Cognataquiflexum aquatile]|uniref:Kazal-type serine protease inhibitor family protein n=1 Tax=Cognataquiflexum aquatile TaxID=2249427 RepID=UPI000DE838ED|nr:Kazal-type serine protease inhibitor [Cognataquiflexum aquatile]
MKNIFQLILTFSVLFLFSFQCEDQNPVDEVLTDCIDPDLIRKDMACLTIYDPVCGCDGKTYGNSCHAGISGVKSFSKGECK